MTIKNGDLPAMPNIAASGIASSERELAEMLSEGRVTTGLTKREMFAMAALQGILANSTNSMSYAARDAVLVADELLAELDRTK